MTQRCRQIMTSLLLLSIVLLQSAVSNALIDEQFASSDTDPFMDQNLENTDEKRAGGRNFLTLPATEKRGGGRNFGAFMDQKRAGGRQFASAFSERWSPLMGQAKRGGGRNFREMLDEKRAGGRGFQMLDEETTAEDKRGGARSFYQGDSDAKRGGARAFGGHDSAEKRGGGRTFQMADGSNIFEKRGGGRTFQFAEDGYDDLSKRGGARPFLPSDLLKRAGGRYFSSTRHFYPASGTIEYGKRGGARPMISSAYKRAGGRAFFGGFDGFGSDFGGRLYAPVRRFYPEYTKKAPYLQYDSKVNTAAPGSVGTILSELKRTDGFPYGMDYESSRTEPLFWGATEKRAGGRTFPIEDDDSKEKRRMLFGGAIGSVDETYNERGNHL
ncbi:CBR-NLP-21 protein [Ditylenchus destructor]|nr:CBR-NLP-21 protein [Ditylenchus destructor]